MEHLQSYSFSEIPEQCARFDEFAARFGNFCLSNDIPVNVMIAYVFNRLGYRLVSSTISKSILPKKLRKGGLRTHLPYWRKRRALFFPQQVGSR